MRHFNNLENKTLSDTYWRVQLVCMKVQANSSLDPPLEHNQENMPLMNQGLLWLFLTILGVIEILSSFRLVLEGKTGKEIPKLSRLEFSKKFLANNFALSDGEGNISGSLNREDIADLPLLRTLLAIGNFVSFKNPFATITSLSELYFKFRRFILLVQTKKMISMNYGSSTSSWKPWRWVRLDLILTMRVI